MWGNVAQLGENRNDEVQQLLQCGIVALLHCGFVTAINNHNCKSFIIIEKLSQLFEMQLPISIDPLSFCTLTTSI